MSEEHFVVIGNGPAGNQAALTLREKAPEDRITLITESREPSYWRRLLPDFIAGKIEEEALYVSSFNSYKSMGIKLRSGQEVVGLDLEGRELILDHKEVLNFTGLIIAVGGKPRIPEPLDVFGDLMFTLKTIGDAKVWIEKLNHVESILMIGGDLTSLALTKALLQLHKEVFFMLDENAFWPLRPNNVLFDEVGQRLVEKGVQVLKCRKLMSVTQISDHLYQIQADDQKIEIGMIGAFFGLVPDIRFLARSGLTIDRGILVDEYLNAGFEGIYATGDCAQIYHPQIRDYWVSIGHDNAVALGRIAAMNLVGERKKAEIDQECIYEVQGINVNTSWWADF